MGNDLMRSRESVLTIPDEPLLVANMVEEEFGAHGCVVIHSIGSGGACGGVRAYPDVSEEEVRALARAMTYKYCFFERLTGGAKGGIQLPSDLSVDERARLFRNVGRHLEPLLRPFTYHAWTDMNFGREDLNNLYRGAGFSLGSGIGDSSYYTALSTMAGIMAAAEHQGIAPESCRVTIEGLGNVGSFVAQEIQAWGGKVVGCSTREGAVENLTGLDVAEIVRLRDRASDSWVKESGNWTEIAREDLFKLPMNVHVPCARVHSLTGQVADVLEARVVVPAANVPCTPDGQDKLLDKGVTLLPDFIINGGGIVGTGLGELGISDEKIRQIFYGDFKNMLLRLQHQAGRQRRAPIELAQEESHRHYSKLVASGRAHQSLGKRVLRRLERNGWVRTRRGKQSAIRLMSVLTRKFRDN